jgi:hypothetical protein
MGSAEVLEDGKLTQLSPFHQKADIADPAKFPPLPTAPSNNSKPRPARFKPLGTVDLPVDTVPGTSSSLVPASITGPDNPGNHVYLSLQGG